jgi:hypothetical protein
MIEVLKQMQKALREYHYYTIDAGLPNQSMLNKGYAAYQAGKKAIAELEGQEPVATVTSETGNPDITMSWWHEPALTVGTKLYTHPPQRTEERNFCSRCGKRTADLTVIHTCTPPQEKNNGA